MSQQELLIRVVDVLNRTGVDYMLTGSVASSFQGEPRSSHDVDLVVAPPPSAAKALAEAFPPPDFYLPEDFIREAIDRRSMFNLLWVTEGDKVDFWMLTDAPFDRSRFARKREEELFGVRMKISSPEDTILAKLNWAKESGGSEKQVTDALRVYEVQRDQLDLAYIDHWAAQLGVEPLWRRLKESAQPMEG
jgi:hypothetical protein